MSIPFYQYIMDATEDNTMLRPREIHRNVTVYVDENTETGEIVLSWSRQPDTEDELIDPIDDVPGYIRVIN